MQIQINTDSHIDGDQALTADVRATVQRALAHHAERITRVEVHLNDENSHKGGEDDQRCLMEARLGGLPPIAVTHKAATVAQAVDGAAERLRNAIVSQLGKLERR